MDTKKSIAVCVTAILYIMLFAVIGSCFMAFKYEDEKIIINDPRIVVHNNIKVVDKENTEINKLKFSEVKLGLKPVTGELDSDTKIPITVTDENGSEGIFAKFKVKNAENFTIKINNLKVEGNSKLEFELERKNIWFAIKEIENSAKNYEENEIILCDNYLNSEDVEYTLLFWLSSVASENFEMSTINFDVIFE